MGGFAFIYGLIIASYVITYIGLLELLSVYFNKSPALFTTVATLCTVLGALLISSIAFIIGWKVGLLLDRVKVWTVGRGVLGGVAAGCYFALLVLPLSGSRMIGETLIIILAQGALGGLFAALVKKKR